MGMALVAMTALSVFHNAQIVNRREGAQRADVVGIGDRFDAPWLVARDLAMAKLAKPDDPDDLDLEPAEAVDPHPSLSVSALKQHNARRQDRRAREARAVRDVADGMPAVTGFEMSQGPALTADPLHSGGAAPSVSAADGLPKPSAETAPSASTVKSNVPPMPSAPGAADAAGATGAAKA